MALKRKIIGGAFASILLVGCTNAQETQYKTTGEIISVRCPWDVLITLENGIEYRSTDSGHCRLTPGVGVTIYHDDGLRVDKIEVDGSEEVTQ